MIWVIWVAAMAMDFGEAIELGFHLVVGRPGGFLVKSGGVQQPHDDVLAQPLQPATHGLRHLFGNGSRLAGRHDGDEAVGQGRRKQRVGIGAALHPLTILEQRVR